MDDYGACHGWLWCMSWMIMVPVMDGYGACVMDGYDACVMDDYGA